MRIKQVFKKYKEKTTSAFQIYKERNKNATEQQGHLTQNTRNTLLQQLKQCKEMF